MIKLNSKNITYIALADSNNSLKAPKEIWYADSNNSVKLVYRRKDALIEGEDYEKYHWLVSNSEDNKTPYIDTLIPPDLNQNIAFSFKVINSTTNGGEPGVYGVLTLTSWYDCVIRCYKNISYNYIILEYNNDNADFPKRENMIIKTEFSEGKEYDCSLSINSSTTALGVINNESKELVANSNVNFVPNPQPTHKLFVQIIPDSWASKWSFNSVGFKKFNITNLISLIPCKLLKPVPKWLDANGIRRQIGECGMIDLVSGKFYGNVNSVGTFTVENYYERKEWLKGDGMAYIDVLRSNEVTDVIHFKVDTSNSGSGNEIRGIFGNLKLGTGVNNTIHFVKYNSGYMACRAFNSDNEVRPVRYNVMSVDILMDSVKVNSDTYELNRDVTALEGYSMPIFSRRRINVDLTTNITNEIIKASLAYFKIDNILDLIPCTLTMDLPASMDANNTPRTKGTSGMWDLVSDRFYGNVASSGMFKAVNLAEGVDYEVHQYLAVEMPKGYFMSLPLDSSTFSYSRIYTSIGNTAHLTSKQDEYAYFSAEMTGVGVWNGSKTTNYKLIDISNLSIVCDSNQLLFNSVEFPIYEFPPIVTFYNTYPTTNTVLKQSAITVDGIERYIPVKLLKSIPSKYDANGISRQAGECGMYDTVNDKFYGNVANSGTFTVSDDS